MADLPEIEQKFIADMMPYLAALDDAIGKSEAFAAATRTAEEAVAALEGTTADAALSMDAALGSTTRAAEGLRNAFAQAAAAGRALKGAGADTGLGGAAAQAAALHQQLNDVILDLMAQSRLLASMDAALGVIRRDVADTSADLMMQTALLREIRDQLHLSAMAATVYNRRVRDSGGAARTAAAATGLWLGGIRMTGRALHWLIMGTLEIASTAIPALFAFGAAIAAMAPTFIHVSDQMNFLRIATGSWKDAMIHSVGPLHNLGIGMGQLSQAVKPDAYIIFGAAINSLAGHFTQFSGVAQQAAGVLARFATKLSGELSGPLGTQLAGFFRNSVHYMIQWGQVLGNLGHTFVNVMGAMPGVGKVLLDVLVAISRVLLSISSSKVGATLLGIAAAMSAVYRYGQLMVTVWKWIGGAALVTALKPLVSEMTAAVGATGEMSAVLTVMKGNVMALGPAAMVAAAALLALGGVIVAFEAGSKSAKDSTDKLISTVQNMPPTLRDLRAGFTMLTSQILKDATGWEALGTAITRYQNPAATVSRTDIPKLIHELRQQAQALVNLVTGLAEASMRSGQIGAAMKAQAVATAIADSKVQQLNQAIDQYMQLVTGGTSALAGFNQSMAQMGSVVGSVQNNLGQFNGTMNLTAKQFSRQLSKSTQEGAQAWINFDQVVGSTAPQLLDWFRQAGVVGAASGRDVTRATLDMTRAMARWAGSNKTAQAQVLAFARSQGISARNWADLTRALHHDGIGQRDLTKRVDKTTIALSHLSQMARNASNALNTQVASALANAALKSTGFYSDLNKLNRDLANHAPRPAIEADLAQIQSDMKLAQKRAVEMGNGVSQGAHRGQAASARMAGSLHKLLLMADNAAGGIRGVKSAMDSLHSKTITLRINTVGGVTSVFGGGLPGGTAGGVNPHHHKLAAGTDAAHRGLAVVGEKGPELVYMRGGEQVVPAHHTKALLHLAGQMRHVTGYAAGTGGHKRLTDQLTRELSVLAPRILAAASVAGISQYVHNLLSTIRQLGSVHAIKGGTESEVIRQIQHDNKRLDHLFKERSHILNRIHKAHQYASGVSQAAQSSASLATIMGTAGGGPVSSAFLLASMRISLGQIRKFDTDIKKLEKLGLDRNLLNQIIQMGPQQGDQVAQALINGPLSNIKALNATESQVQRASKNLGHTAANDMFDSGKQAGKGFLSGLKSQEAQIEKLMKHVAATMVTTLRHELGIPGIHHGGGHHGGHHGGGHGPRLHHFAAIGADLTAGLAAGVHSRLPAVTTALSHAGAVRGGHGLPVMVAERGGETAIYVNVEIKGPNGRRLFEVMQTQTLRVNKRNTSNHLALTRGRGR